MADEKLTPEQEELQAKLLDEFMDPYYFGDQHDFAARAEILRLRARVAELEARGGNAEKGSTVVRKAGKAERGDK